MNEKLKKFTYDMSTALLGKDLVDTWGWKNEEGQNHLMKIVKKVLDDNGISLEN